MEKHQAHVRYSAEEYDRYTADFVKPFDDMLASRVLEEALPRLPGALLLDIGAGTARFLVRLAMIPELAALRLVGTDLFEDMVEQARRTVEAANASDRVEMIVADVHAMNLSDAYADIVLSRSTLHHCFNLP